MTCAWCKKTIDGADDSHGICPECVQHIREKEIAEIEEDERRKAA